MFEIYYDDWLSSTPSFDGLQGGLEDEALVGPHYLYRAISNMGEILYVGETHNPRQRIEQHSKTSDWYHLAKSILVYNCASRTEALAIEKTSIKLEKPLYNNQKKKNKPVKETGEVRHCLGCGGILGSTWARRDQKYCDSSCRDAYWYRVKTKKFYDERYQRFKREWEKSPNGKRAGVPIREWLKLPKDWR